MVRVTSEIGRLRRVLVHEPGPEVDRMVPAMMEELLFDDILYGDRARDEHRRFRQVLRLLGVEVLESRDLLAAALEEPGAREWLVEIIADDLPASLREVLESAAPDRLAAMLLEGVRAEPGDAGEEGLFRLPPLPNWCFQRDPQVVFGEGVIFGSMATPARYREGLLTRTIFRFHPELATTKVLFDPLVYDCGRSLFLGLHRPRLEGGDLLVLSPDVVVAGHSERTNHVALRRLARALAQLEDPPRWLLIVDLPRKRAFMHLDTLFTLVDRDACLVHAPVVLGAGGRAAEVYAVDLHGKSFDPVGVGGLLPALAERGLEFEPIVCGGEDPVSQAREQWTDGANALALAPGVITLYDRNRRTAEQLDRRGFRIVSAEELLLGREELTIGGGGRACVLLASHEISRARGGPRCLTHPLLRDDP